MRQNRVYQTTLLKLERLSGQEIRGIGLGGQESPQEILRTAFVDSTRESVSR